MYTVKISLNFEWKIKQKLFKYVLKENTISFIMLPNFMFNSLYYMIVLIILLNYFGKVIL